MDYKMKKKKKKKKNPAVAVELSLTAVHDPAMDTEPTVAPSVPPASTSTPMDVDEATASPSSCDIRTDTSAIYFDRTP